MRILVVGDTYCPCTSFEAAFDALADGDTVDYVNVEDRPDWQPSTPSERGLTEYLGSPDQVIAALDGHDVLVVQGAPVTAEVIAADPALRLICCARGGPVNIDIAAASARGIPVVTTPGKNADSVADLTIAFMIMLARRIPEAMRYVDGGGAFGTDNYEGVRWFGHDLVGRTIGLVGFGQVGHRVASRASAFGSRLLAHDPFLDAADIVGGGAQPCDLDGLLAESDIVSLHARLTPENRGAFGAAFFGRMRPAALFVNTARHELLHEQALLEALASGRLGGAALDVATPSSSGRHPLLAAHPNVVIVPHIGGATWDTLERGAQMAGAEVQRLRLGLPLVNVANRSALPSASEVRR